MAPLRRNVISIAGVMYHAPTVKHLQIGPDGDWLIVHPCGRDVSRPYIKKIQGSVDISWGFHRLAAIYSNHFHTALPVVFLSYIVSDVIPSERENVHRRDRAMPFPKNEHHAVCLSKRENVST